MKPSNNADSQYDKDWFKGRLGKVTASKVSIVMGKSSNLTYKNYQLQLASERLTCVPADSFTSHAMMNGLETEPLARTAYEMVTGKEVSEVGFVTHPNLDFFGASPDGVLTDVDEDGKGLIEIKCPAAKTHLEYLINKKIPMHYQWQMRAQIACTNADWCDFISFNDNFPQNLQLLVIRYYRDEVSETIMLNKIKQFDNEVNAILKSLNNEVVINELLCEPF